MIPELRTEFNKGYLPEKYAKLRLLVEERCGAPVDYRIAETPVFLPLSLLNEMAKAGAELTRMLMENPACLAAARRAIPAGYLVAGETDHPHFLTADFALVESPGGGLVPKLVEIQAFPSVYGYQDVLCSAYRDAYGLGDGVGIFLSGLNEESYWELLGRTILGGHAKENVVLTEVDPMNQKTLPDFLVMARRLGIAVVDIRALEAQGNKLHYRDREGRLVAIHRIYNRAIADELMAREIRLPFDLTQAWDVEWAGHPNWYFLISKFSIPWLSRPPASHPVVPPAVFVSDFLEGNGRGQLEAAGVPLPAGAGPETTYCDLLLKPLFSFGNPVRPDAGATGGNSGRTAGGLSFAAADAVCASHRDAVGDDPGRDSHPLPLARWWQPDPGSLAGAAGPRQDDGRGPQQGPGMGGGVGCIFPKCGRTVSAKCYFCETLVLWLGERKFTRVPVRQFVGIW